MRAWLGVTCLEVMGLAEPELGRGRNTLGKSWIWRPQTGEQEHSLAPGWSLHCRHSRMGPDPHSHPHTWAKAPLHKARLPPRRCRPQGDEEQVASGCSKPVVLHHNPTFLDTEQHHRRCFNPGGGSLRLGIGASISQPCSDSVFYFGY